MTATILQYNSTPRSTKNIIAIRKTPTTFSIDKLTDGDVLTPVNLDPSQLLTTLQQLPMQKLLCNKQDISSGKFTVETYYSIAATIMASKVYRPANIIFVNSVTNDYINNNLFKNFYSNYKHVSVIVDNDLSDDVMVISAATKTDDSFDGALVYDNDGNYYNPHIGIEWYDFFAIIKFV